MAKKDILTLDAKSSLVFNLADDFIKYVQSNEQIPDNISYKLNVKKENDDIERSARIAALDKLSEQNVITKKSFDTRRIDQESDRNPRTNLQFWHRSEPFITEGNQKKINTFVRLALVLRDLKKEFGTRPDWHESYARVLYDAVERILMFKQGSSGDIDSAQLSYLEQLLDARYRLSLDDIITLSKDKLKSKILSKDENLLKRGIIYNEQKNSNNDDKNDLAKFMEFLTAQANAQAMTKNTNSNDNAKGELASLFGGNFRREGERTVERTITITIKDEVKD